MYCSWIFYRSLNPAAYAYPLIRFSNRCFLTGLPIYNVLVSFPHTLRPQYLSRRWFFVHFSSVHYLFLHFSISRRFEIIVILFPARCDTSHFEATILFGHHRSFSLTMKSSCLCITSLQLISFKRSYHFDEPPYRRSICHL